MLSARNVREKMLFTHRGLSGPAILRISSYWKPGEALVIELLPEMPKRLAKRWAERSGSALEWIVMPKGTEGFEKKVRGLFFVGEAVDVTGHLGGFNFQWAWASGFAAGQYV